MSKSDVGGTPASVGGNSVKVDFAGAPQGGDPLHAISAQVFTVKISSLVLQGSPRIAGEDESHVRVLAEIQGELPPIVVSRATMRVVDGMHRVQAALLRKEETINAHFFDGSDEEEFVTAVRLNMAHGLPLTLADRKAAAARIIEAHPQWSSRAVAAATGLSDKTVGALRRCSSADFPQTNARIGRDGRVRRLNRRDDRQRAGDLVVDAPDAPVREIAKAAGIPLATAHDVRQRVRRGEDPVPPRQRATRVEGQAAKKPALMGGFEANAPTEDKRIIVQQLKNDPSLRFSENGRTLLRLLAVHAMNPAAWSRLIAATPDHLKPSVKDLAKECALAWHSFAEALTESSGQRQAN